jgi:hypothetical protein
LGPRHESCLIRGHVGSEIRWKLHWVEVSEAVRRLPYRIRFADVAREALPIVSFALSRIWHVGGDVNQANNRRVCSCLGNHGAPVAVRYKNARSILLSKDALGGRDIFLERSLRFLDNADLVTILDQNVVNTFPAGAICPSSVYQNDVSNAMICGLC